MPAPRPSATMNSSPRPQSRTSNSSSSKVTSSPRPVSRSTATSAKPSATQARSNPGPTQSQSNRDNQGQTTPAKRVKPTTANPGTPPVPGDVTPGTPIPPDRGGSPGPAPGSNPNLPADSVQASRGDRRADRTLIDALQQPGASRSAQKYRGTVLSSVYKLPADPAKSAQTLQQFNGPRGQRMTLGA